MCLVCSQKDSVTIADSEAAESVNASAKSLASVFSVTTTVRSSLEKKAPVMGFVAEELEEYLKAAA